MTVRIAVVGAGLMGSDHARIISGDMPGATLQVVCDASDDRARAVADRYGATDAATDPLATVARADVDAVLIASPDETHAELTIAAVVAGKPVLCEKPLAPTAADCQRVIAAEIECGRLLVQIGFMRRFDPSYAEMRRARTHGTVGRALMMHNFHRNVSSPGTWFTGDMAVTNSAPHEFDIARYVLGCEYRSISALQPRRSDDATAPVMMILETTDGQLVNVEVNNNAGYGYDVRGELVGETGSVHLTANVTARYDLEFRASETYAPDWRPRFAEAYRLQNKAWLQAIESGRPSEVAANSWDGYCAAVVAEAGVRSLREGRKVDVEVEDVPALYQRFGEAA